MTLEAPVLRPEATGVDAEIESHVLTGQHRQALLMCTRHYAPSIGRLCMALLGSQSEAEDATQEILMEAHASFASWRAEGSLKGWLFTIARRRCAKTLERRGRRENRLRLVQSAPGTEHAEDWMLRRERAQRARSAIDTIRPSEREALLLRFAGDLSFREVGEACGIDEAAARKRVSRALARLRTVIESNE
ncbi:MAG: RNA polymerase sigma factor, partial [Polyangiaceae bacterium]